MKLPYGYVLVGEEIVVHEEKADVVRSIFESINEQNHKMPKAALAERRPS